MARPKDPAVEKARREQVLDATITLLERGSWHATSLAAVAAEAGVSKGVVTYWFPEKDALIVAAMERYHERTSARLLAVATSGGTVEDRFTRLIEAAFPSVDAVVAEVAFQAEVMSFAKTSPVARAQITQAYQLFRAASNGLIAMGRAEGFVTASLPGTADLVHALVDGASLMVAADPTIDLPRLRASVVAHLLRWLRDEGGPRC